MKNFKHISTLFISILLIFSGCTVETKDTTPPANPSGVSLTPSGNNLIISWVTPGDYDFDGVEVTHETDTSSSKVKLSSERNSKQAILIEQVNKEILNKFTISSVDIYGNKSSGIIKTYGKDITPPQVVSSVTISEDDFKITVSWKNPTDEDFVQTVVSVKYPEIAEELKIPVQGKSGSDSSLPLPKPRAGEYTFTLTAQDSSGNSSNPTVQKYTVEIPSEPDTTLPAKPQEITAESEASSITISWKNPSDEDFFNTEIKINDKEPIIIQGSPSQNASYTFTDLKESTEYKFTLCSVDNSFNKSESEEISATTKSNQIIKTEKQTVTFSNTNANFTMIDISFTDGRTDDSIILGEDLLEVPYTTNVKPFRLAMYETSYNTWYEVLKWAENNGYTIVNKGVEGVFGEVENEKNMSDAGAEPKLVEMPVCRLTWRDVMVWCNALSEMKGLKPVYCTDKDFKTPLRDSTGVPFNDLNNYATEPGEVDNPYVNTNANGFRLPYVKEWEYAARKRLNATAISGRNVSGDETGSAIKTTATEQMNGLSFPLSTKQNEYCWQRQNSASNGPSETYTGQDDTTTTLSAKTGKSISGRRMHLSGGRLPNHLGFFDMSGNVPEWCFDYDLPYGSINKFSTGRGLRGGDHLNEIVGSRCSGNKGGALVGLSFGFRIAQNH
ncbi:MAG: SUMF1/EgtB/PvdO family nonheme iron enzyme [Treponema sp.]|nr:SUMF1/EgtB/PvdO family nonheme iron enzyme [Treponema sp.]